MVEREQFNEIPPHVEYRLSGHGFSVLPILHEMCSRAGQFDKSGKDKTLPRCRRSVCYGYERKVSYLHGI